MLDILPALSDLACFAFACFAAMPLWRVLTATRGRSRVRDNDPIWVVALLLLSGRYGFTLVRWAFGGHRELLSAGEVLGKQAAFAWSVATVVVAGLVIAKYRVVRR